MCKAISFSLSLSFLNLGRTLVWALIANKTVVNNKSSLVETTLSMGDSNENQSLQLISNCKLIQIPVTTNNNKEGIPKGSKLFSNLSKRSASRLRKIPGSTQAAK